MPYFEVLIYLFICFLFGFYIYIVEKTKKKLIAQIIIDIQTTFSEAYDMGAGGYMTYSKSWESSQAEEKVRNYLSQL